MEDYFTYTAKLFDQRAIKDKPEVFKGLRVLDFTHVIYGPTASKILATYGAEVIKLELPYYGDMWRPASYWGKYWKHSNPIWHFITQNKYFVALDLKLQEAKDLIYRMAKDADIVLENFAPGTAEAWGVGYTSISKVNPEIIYLSCSTYGQYGPMRYFPGWDLLAQAASGVLRTNGFPGTDKYYKLPDYLGDFIPGNMAALVLTMALYHRNKTGQGQYLDLSQTESMMRMLPHFTYHSFTGEELERSGHADPSMVAASIFKSRDGRFLGLACATEKQFEGLCSAMEKKELLSDKRFSDYLEALKEENAEALRVIVGDWIKTKDCDEVIRLALENGFAAAEVMDDHMICQDEWRRARGSVVLFDDDMYGELAVAAPSAQLSKTPGRTKWLARPLGYHNRYVLLNLVGLTEAEIEDLEKKDVIGTFDDKPGLKPPIYYHLDKDPIYNYGREVRK
ncbi:MAG: CoA transferase [Syntrophales bacterium]|jgi:crotonobetainyl-CoA:carnitine CoA-transferase CaiB-like acyl-CoA transferase|nr:CoA transferase [Syntrophales bacterium]MDY0044306.1 CoA transferase [Syntrophales bacterium]